MIANAAPAPLRVAGIGIGARAGLLAHFQAAGATIVATADPAPGSQERAEELLGHSVEHYSSAAQVLAAIPDLDAAVVLTPDDTHEAVALELLQAGIAVYLEKPIAISIEAADRVLEAAYLNGAKLYVGHNMRHMDVVTLMKDIIDRGDIGDVKAVWCRHFVGDGGDFYFKDWHADRSKVLSLLLQKGAHDLDVIQWLAGGSAREVVGVGDLAVYGDVRDRRDNSDHRMIDWYSRQSWPPLTQRHLNPVIDVEDVSMIMGRLENGVVFSYQQCHFTPDYWRNYTVIGTEGRIENAGDCGGGEIRVWNRRVGYSEHGDVQVPIADGEGGHGGADPVTVAEFCDFVRTGSATQTSPVAARDAVATGVAGALSIRGGGQPQRIPGVSSALAKYFAAHQRL